MSKEHIVIVGSGMAGGKLVEELCLQAPDKFKITIVGEEACGNYDRIKLVNKLKDPHVEDFWLNSEEWYTLHGVEAILGHQVKNIDTANKTITIGKYAQKITYDKLVLATGSLPFIPPFKGNSKAFVLRTIEDAENIRRTMEQKEQILVIGGGLLGLELAYGLKEMGKSITITDAAETIMSQQLDEQGSEVLKRKLRKKGMKFILGTHVTQVSETEDNRLKVQFYSGRIEEMDLLVICAGVIPNKALAEECGLFTNRGILVNQYLETSVPGIFAIGECTEYKGQTLGLVAPVYEQVRVLASHFVGSETAESYQSQTLTAVRLKCDIPVISMGLAESKPNQAETVFHDPKGLVYKKLIYQGEQLLGALLIGEDLNVDAITLHYTAKLPLPTDSLTKLLFPGAGAEENQVPDTSAWPDDIIICNCNGITAGRVRKVIEEGADTMFSAVQISRAGTGCGNCKNRVKGLLIDSVGELRKDPREDYYLPGVPMTRLELEEAILNNQWKSVAEVLDSVPDSKGDAKTRMGMDYLLSYLWKDDYEEQKDSQFVNDRYHANIQRDGTFSVIPRIHGGNVTAKELRRIADVAEKYKVKLIKITGADRIGLFSVKREQLANVWQDLDMDAGHAYGKFHRAAKACVGSTFCRFGLRDSQKMGEMMDDRYRGMKAPAKTKIGSSGCPRNCAEATIKDFGVIASGEGWDIFIGGNAGAKVVAAQKLTHVQEDEEVFRIADRFFEYYRRHGLYHERTANFVKRVSFETVRDAILFDTDENLEKLEKDFQEYRNRYQDPWKQEESWQHKPDMVEV